jgi:hypothetical protein
MDPANADEAVREALLDQGVEPARVAVAPPVAEESSDDGVATRLSLAAEASGAASVGAGARSR